ncbi:MAG: 7-cyano-7-deazaguanine synthase QueC [Candidatus Thermoplasmatota archaeon]|jgi:7-cyano-7-deazaguanine synthase|nr:7-cyano-7-deazaguanine synthase QueC [Candidatus Thermoplasmatota archaeon]
MVKKKAVCLISGGIDSCVSALIAKKKGYIIYALTINYNQRHKREIENAKKIAQYLKAKKHVILNLDISLFNSSSLINKNKKLEINRSFKDIGRNIPSTYVPARNTIFLALALAFAEAINAEAIFIGVTATDYSGYPDCRPEFIRVFQKLSNVATKKGLENKPIKIIAPLLFLKKSQIIKKGLELNAPFDKTWSCYMGGKKACGRCDSCLLRLKGFKEAGINDPIDYQSLPKWYIKKWKH